MSWALQVPNDGKGLTPSTDTLATSMTLWGVQGHSRSLLVSPSSSWSWGRLGGARVLIKCSAAESVPYSQAAHLKIVNTVASRVSTGTGAEGGSDEILGVLILSSLLGGRQELPIVGSLYANGQDGAARNVLTTEPCMDWFSTAQAMEALAAAVRHRRAVVSKKPRLS